MGRSRTRLRRSGLAATMLTAACAGACFSFSDLTGGDTSDAGDAAARDVITVNDAAPFDAGELADGAPVTFATCAAAHAAAPSAPDGFFLLTSSDGGAPLKAYCDMTSDQGGWMLVTPAMIAIENLVSVTATHNTDPNGGLIVQNYANNNPCGTADAGLPAQNLITFTTSPMFTQIRASYTFNGLVSCWSAFGAPSLSPGQNLLPFNAAIDTIYDQVKMGGVLADGGPLSSFGGALTRCDQLDDNFWQNNTIVQRSAVVILRRDVGGPAGLATAANCLKGAAPGTTSAANWGYREIYVR